VAIQFRRREFIAAFGGAAAWPLAARAQQGDRMRRIGVLLPAAADNAVFQTRMAAFLGGLQQLGWADGRNVRIDTRWAAGDADLRKYAEELITLRPDVVMATTARHSGSLPRIQRG
jgi:putative ABC transport system substrate-binding protein